MVLLVVAGGLAGLCLAVLNRKDSLVLLLCQPMIVVLAVLGREMWYPVYIVPLTAVGLGHVTVGVRLVTVSVTVATFESRLPSFAL